MKKEDKIKRTQKNSKKNKNLVINSELERFDPSFDKGLSTFQVDKRIEQGLVNANTSKKGKSIIRILVDNIFTFFNMLYLAITILLCLAHSWSDLFYLIIVIPNLAIGIFQEIRAKKMIDKLSLVSAPKAKVIRDGKELIIDTTEVVVDDVIVLKSGDQIYTDSIVINGSVEANESLLTGEADAISKNVGAELFSGSFVSSGACYAKVEHVGKDNYIEKLASEAKKHQKPKSELLRTLKVIIKVVGIIIIPLGLFTMWGYWQSSEIADGYERFISTIQPTAAVILGMIPSGLFLLTSVALFVGVINLANKRTLVQELYCIEMLARVDILCLDKTGTITDGTMRVVDCVEVKNPTDFTVREIIGSMMNSFSETNATSDALIRFFDTNKVLTPVNIIPFSSKRKYSAVSFKDPETDNFVGTFYLGAPEFVLIDQYEKMKSQVERFAAQGCRVLILGFSSGLLKEKQATPKGVKPLALIVIQDHIREDAYKTIDYFKKNNVDVKVISGDNPMTVSEIARRAGVANANRYISLEGMSDEEVFDVAFEYTVFGRVTPSQKKVLVQAFKAQKKTVAMTGDGVNDILALKEADCSIAMASGSEATRYVAHLVLLDSSFASMPEVVSEGRRVINNIQRTSSLFLVKTMLVIMLTIMYIFLQKFTSIGFGYPFLKPSMLMLIEIFAIGIPAAILAIQPNKEKVHGKFIANVMKTVLPAAFTIVVCHAILYFLIPVFGWNKEIYSTITIILTNTICLFVLFDVSRPFNWWKILIFIIFTSITIAAYVLSMVDARVFEYVQAVPLLDGTKENLLVLICGVFASYYVLSFFRQALNKKKKTS